MLEYLDRDQKIDSRTLAKKVTQKGSTPNKSIPNDSRSFSDNRPQTTPLTHLQRQVNVSSKSQHLSQVQQIADLQGTERISFEGDIRIGKSSKTSTRVKPGSVPIYDSETLTREKRSNSFQFKAANPSTGKVVQRAITVQNIDFDPVMNDFRHGYINQGNFYQTLRGKLWALAAFDGYRNQWPNVKDILAAADWEEPDISQLSGQIRDNIIAEYQHRGLAAIVGISAQILTCVSESLSENIQADHQMAFDADERNVFDGLIAAAGVAASKAKGAPTQVPEDRLGGGTTAQVAARTLEITNEKGLWTIGGLTRADKRRYFFLRANHFAEEIIGRQRGLRYQGNHTNNAGWLPAVATPVDAVTTARANIDARISPRLKRILKDPTWSDRLGFSGPHAHRPNQWGNEFTQLINAHVDTIGDAALKQAAIEVLCQNVSAYIEFSMGGGFSRFVYDPVNDRKYITAHYKWRNGYNPFFRIT